MNPEKASSFNIHPERNCSDCCFFCRQKFGLTETPLHILQMKSLEIQKFASGHHRLRKDHCLCDRCFRLLNKEAKKFKRESEGEPEMPRDKKGAKYNRTNYEDLGGTELVCELCKEKQLSLESLERHLLSVHGALGNQNPEGNENQIK